MMNDLQKRAERCIEIIGEMCKDGRPPKMSIPVQPTDEDVFIQNTIRGLMEENTEMLDSWLRLMRELAALADAADTSGDSDWELATDDILLEQFDPWATIRDAKAVISALGYLV